MDELVKEVFIFISGVGVGMGFLSWWTLKSLKTHDLTFINGKDVWVEWAGDDAEYSEQIEKMAKEIASAGGVPPKYW